MQITNLPSELTATAAAWRTATAACETALARHALVFLTPEGGGWIDTSLCVESGETLTLLARGQVWLSREADLAFGPNVTLWYRIGDGPIARSMGNTATVVAANSGPLWMVAKPPGEWADTAGNFLADYPHGGASGGLLVAALVWRGDAEAGLQRLASHDTSGAAEAELERRKNEKPLPSGWQPLWRVGETGMFCTHVETDGKATILCRCDNDAAILKYPLDRPLTSETRLSWAWRVDQLPSAVAENTLGTHDYLSVAIEFDNGQDLTFYWSSALPVGAAFRCPIPWWDKHETHVVCRSGTNNLGRWMDEEEPILSHYEKAVGGAVPARIVGVWLIALSPFQRKVAQAAFRNLQLVDSEGAVWIGP